MVRSNKDIFMDRANEIHKNEYNYSQSIYINNKTKIKIICKTHGEFWQTPNAHLRGQKCFDCFNDKRKTSVDEFVKKSIKSHGYKYLYSKVNYKNNHTKVEIICSIHGSFWQKPLHHIHRNGCPKCSSNKLKNKEEFICDAIKCHGKKYDYSEFIYKNAKTAGKIICPAHRANSNKYPICI